MKVSRGKVNVSNVLVCYNVFDVIVVIYGKEIILWFIVDRVKGNWKILICVRVK